MNDDFCNEFNAWIEETDKTIPIYPQNMNIGNAHPIQIGSGSYMPYIESEPLISIYLPESEAKRLIHDTMNHRHDMEMTHKDPRIYKEWLRYRTMLELLR